MRVYVGQTRSAKLVRRLWEMGIGECTQPDELPPRRYPYMLDNLAFQLWKKGLPFDVGLFQGALNAVWNSLARPEFIVLPDIVGGGPASIELSKQWVNRCRGLAPLYLPVQDGVLIPHIDDKLRSHISGLFVGGSLEWKLRTGRMWVKAAHRLGLRCHVGRVGTGGRVRWARDIGADSIDSCLPLFSEENMMAFLRALE